MKKNLLIVGLAVLLAIIAFNPRKGSTDSRQPAAPEIQAQSAQQVPEASPPPAPVAAEQPADTNHIKIRIAKISLK